MGNIQISTGVMNYIWSESCLRNLLYLHKLYICITIVLTHIDLSLQYRNGKEQ